jgi:predicted peroxiredoxin
MKRFLTKLAIVGVLLSPVTVFADNAKNLMVIVTTEDAMTQLMSMVLAVESQAKGAKVDILLCGKAGDLVIKDSKEVILKPKNVSPQMLLKKLIKSGSEVGVCPLYLPNSTKTKADLIDGVVVVSPANMAELILDNDTKILSY